MVEEAVEDIRKGRMVVVADDESRENEGDVVMAAEKVMPEHVNFITKEARGLLCVPLTPERIRELELPLMVREPTEATKTAFTVSVDAASCTSGISAFERARTIRLLAFPDAGPSDFVRPGHVFPLRAMEGGVLRRPGHTEAAVDLAWAAGLQPAGLISR